MNFYNSIGLLVGLFYLLLPYSIPLNAQITKHSYATIDDIVLDECYVRDTIRLGQPEKTVFNILSNRYPSGKFDKTYTYLEVNTKYFLFECGIYSIRMGFTPISVNGIKLLDSFYFAIKYNDNSEVLENFTHLLEKLESKYGQATNEFTYDFGDNSGCVTGVEWWFNEIGDWLLLVIREDNLTIEASMMNLAFNLNPTLKKGLDSKAVGTLEHH